MIKIRKANLSTRENNSPHTINPKEMEPNYRLLGVKYFQKFSKQTLNSEAVGFSASIAQTSK